MKKVYLDSNVLISLIQDEFGKGDEFMSYRTKNFLDKTLNCFYTIVISSLVLTEIKRITGLQESKVMVWFYGFEDKVEIVQISLDEMDKAEIEGKKRGVGRADAAHFMLAKRENCSCIVTWNKKHFSVFEGIRICDPSEL